MAPHPSGGGRLTGTDQNPHLQLALDEASVEHPEVIAWFAEAKRLFAEAEERFGAGRVLPALSSLAAVPPVHHMLVDRCSDLLVAPEPAMSSEPDAPNGMYL